MIEAYHRPQSIEEALALLADKARRNVPIGGGSAIDRFTREPLGVVDLQAIGLDTWRVRGNFLELGATLTLENMLAIEALNETVRQVIKLEAGYNLRQVATVAGTLVAARGRSPFTTMMLAYDAVLRIKPDDREISLGNLLPLRDEMLTGRLITGIRIPLVIQAAFEYVSRTPADQPLVSAAVVIWPSGRTRVALGGWGVAPVLAMDGPQADGAEEAAHEAYAQAEDVWASAEYRREIARILVQRCLENLKRA